MFRRFWGGVWLHPGSCDWITVRSTNLKDLSSKRSPTYLTAEYKLWDASRVRVTCGVASHGSVLASGLRWKSGFHKSDGIIYTKKGRSSGLPAEIPLFIESLLLLPFRYPAWIKLKQKNLHQVRRRSGSTVWWWGGEGGGTWMEEAFCVLLQVFCSLAPSQFPPHSCLCLEQRRDSTRSQ